MAFSTWELCLSQTRPSARLLSPGPISIGLNRLGCGSHSLPWEARRALHQAESPSVSGDFSTGIQASDHLRKAFHWGVSMARFRGGYYSLLDERLHPENPHPRGIPSYPARSHLPCRTLGYTKGSPGPWKLTSGGGRGIPCCCNYLKSPLVFVYNQVRTSASLPSDLP